MALKATTDRQKSFDELVAALDFSLEDVLADLEELLASSGSESRVGAAELGVLPRELLAHLKRLLEILLEKDDQAHSGDLDVRAKGRELRAAFMAARGELMRTRDLLRNAYGPAQADKLLLGVPKQIPRHLVDGLLRMGWNTLRQLRDPEVEVTMHENMKAGYPKGKETFVTLLEEAIDHLREANKRHVKAEVRQQGFIVEKIEAMEEYNRSFPEIAKIFECLFRLTRRVKLAKDIQPSGQEKGLLLKLTKLRRAIRAGLKEAKESRGQAASEQESTAKQAKDSPSS